jgi:hypothetical protein
MIFIALLLSMAAPSVPDAAPAPSHHVEELLRQTDGATQERAFKVSSVQEEYQILRALGLQPKMQDLMFVRGHPYDVLTVTDPKTGQEHKLWFDINSFFGKEF